MQDHINYLVIEDKSEWRDAIDQFVRKYFSKNCDFKPDRIHSTRLDNARDADETISSGKWDLVTLDLSLGEKAGAGKISGLDLLAQIAAGNRAFFVIIITGAYSDPDLEKIYGRERGMLMKIGAMNEAVKLIPEERVRILNKPAEIEFEKAFGYMESHLHEALDQYCDASRERNIFRRIDDETKRWEIRFNGGKRVHFKHTPGFSLIQNLLVRPGQELNAIKTMIELGRHSGLNGPLPLDLDLTSFKDDKIGKRDTAITALGNSAISASDMQGGGIGVKTMIPTGKMEYSIDDVIQGLLHASRYDKSLDNYMQNALKEFGVHTIRQIPDRISEWIGRGSELCEINFNCDEAVGELIELSKKIRPIIDSFKDSKEKGKMRVARGFDCRELMNSRQYISRFRKLIREAEGLE